MVIAQQGDASSGGCQPKKAFWKKKTNLLEKIFVVNNNTSWKKLDENVTLARKTEKCRQ